MSVTSALSHERAVSRILELSGKPGPAAERPWLVLTVGLPGSGKSTFCRGLAAGTGVIVLESDALRVALFGSPTHDTEESKQLFQALYGAATALLRDGVSVIVDATNLRESDRQAAYDAAKATGAGLLVLHFRAPESVILERLTRRERRDDPEDRSTAGRAVYAKLAETEQPIRRRHWKIDTSDPRATQAALHRAIEMLRPKRTASGRDREGISL